MYIIYITVKFHEIISWLNLDVLETSCLARTKIELILIQCSTSLVLDLFRNDMSSHGGGHMVYIRSDISCRSIGLTDLNTKNVEILCIECNLNNTKWAILFATNHRVCLIQLCVLKCHVILIAWSIMCVLWLIWTVTCLSLKHDLMNMYNLSNGITETLNQHSTGVINHP